MIHFNNQFSQSLYEALLLLEGEGLYYGTHVSVSDGIDKIFTECLVDIGQYPREEINEKEPVVFEATASSVIPRPFFERQNFPHVTHLLRNTGVRKSPCIYTAQEEQIALEWNAFRYALDLRNWLNLVAEGVLHDRTQQLEDVVLTNGGSLIIANDFINNGEIHLHSHNEAENTFFLRNYPTAQEDNRFLIRNIVVDNVPHQGIRVSPSNLIELQELIDAGKHEFEIASFLKNVCSQSSNYNKRLLFIQKGTQKW